MQDTHSCRHASLMHIVRGIPPKTPDNLILRSNLRDMLALCDHLDVKRSPSFRKFLLILGKTSVILNWYYTDNKGPSSYLESRQLPLPGLFSCLFWFSISATCFCWLGYRCPYVFSVIFMSLCPSLSLIINGWTP